MLLQSQFGLSTGVSLSWKLWGWKPFLGAMADMGRLLKTVIINVVRLVQHKLQTSPLQFWHKNAWLNTCAQTHFILPLILQYQQDKVVLREDSMLYKYEARDRNDSRLLTHWFMWEKLNSLTSFQWKQNKFLGQET